MAQKQFSEKVKARAYLLLRIGMGLSFALYAAMRFGDIDYSNHLLSVVQNEDLRSTLLFIFAFLLPVIQVVAGFLLCLGFRVQWSLWMIGVIILILIGASMVSDYREPVSQLLLFFFILYWLFRHQGEDRLSFDQFLKYSSNCLKKLRKLEYPPKEKPLMIWGMATCGFCAYWVVRWQKITGNQLNYIPFQEVSHAFPDIR
ncbi:MAG: hypothetical protein U5L96_21205 [Owenweeksia sp.]|nr:hypothetical protein [Owenweeksia sp.]